MLSPRLRATAERWLPPFFLRALNPFETRIEDEITAFAASLPRGSRVLDAGAGECRHAPLFAAHRYVALDMAIGDTAWDYSRLDLISNLEQLPVARGSFDAAISVVVLEHTRDPRRVLCELAMALRPGGRLLIVVPQEWEVHQAPHDYFRYTSYGMAHLFESAGLLSLRIEPVGGFFWLMGRRSINMLSFFQGGARWPLFVLLAPLLGFAVPLLFYYLDRLDGDRNFTLGYVCEAER